MTTTIKPTPPASRHRDAGPATPSHFRKPNYDCRGQDDAMTLVVYVPGVDGAGVSIEARGPDLVITARKTRFVRVNWQAAHLEGAQRDYRLSLRLGSGFAYEAMQAEISHGVLTVTLPKRRGAPARSKTMISSNGTFYPSVCLSSPDHHDTTRSTFPLACSA